jgi:hypothetical protein
MGAPGPDFEIWESKTQSTKSSGPRPSIVLALSPLHQRLVHLHPDNSIVVSHFNMELGQRHRSTYSMVNQRVPIRILRLLNFQGWLHEL